jgi:hypothetical protein
MKYRFLVSIKYGWEAEAPDEDTAAQMVWDTVPVTFQQPAGCEHIGQSVTVERLPDVNLETVFGEPKPAGHFWHKPPLA